MNILTGKRVFVYNGRTLQDPDPTLPAERVLKAWQDQYPELVNATVDDPEVNPDEGTVTYKVNVKVGRAG